MKTQPFQTATAANLTDVHPCFRTGVSSCHARCRSLACAVPAQEDCMITSKSVLVFCECRFNTLGSLCDPICFTAYVEKGNLYSGKNSKPSPSRQVPAQEVKGTCSHDASSYPAGQEARGPRNKNDELRDPRLCCLTQFWNEVYSLAPKLPRTM